MSNRIEDFNIEEGTLMVGIPEPLGSYIRSGIVILNGRWCGTSVSPESGL